MKQSQWCACGCGTAIVIILLITGIVLVSVSLKRLETNDVGLRYDVNARKLDTEPRFEGLYAWVPGFRFIVFPSVTDTIEFDDLKCLNIDGLTIRLWVTFQYRPRPEAMHKLVMQFRDHDQYKTLLEYVASSAIRDVCSSFNATQFQKDRSSLQEDISERLVERFEQVDCDVIEVQVNNIERPDEYEDTLSQKEGAREDIKVAQQEEPLQLTEAETGLQKAYKDADIKISKAKSDAVIMISKAEAEAESILHTYEKEAETYKVIVSESGFGFDTDGFLAYLGVRVIEDAHKDIYINMDEPVHI